MQLKLHAVRYPPGAPIAPVTFGQEGGTIGRSNECTLVVPDPRKFISRVHVQVRCRAGNYSLKVISRVNPVLVSNVPVGFNEAVEIKDGDTVVLGDYELQATLVEDLAVFAPRPPAYDDPFASLSSSYRRPASREEDTLKDPFFRGAEPVTGSLVSGLPQTSGGGLGDLVSSTDRLNKDDPLLGILSGNAVASGGGMSGLGGMVTAAEDNTIDRFLAQGGTAGAGLPGARRAVASPGSLGAHSDHVHDINLPFQPPRATNTRGTDVPFPGRRETDGRPAIDDSLFAILSGGSATAAFAPPGPAPVPPSGLDEDVFAIFDAPGKSSGPVPAKAAGAVFPTPPVPDTDAQDTVAQRRHTPSRQDLIAAFAAGVGMPDLVVAPEDAEAFMAEAGKMLRQSIEGIYDLLILRAEVKKELRAEDRTMIASRENNPLKHTESIEEALVYLMQFKNQNPAFLPPVKAIQDACNDVRAHELAVMAGMRAGLAGVIKRFEPHILESRIKKGGALSAVLPALYKSKLWDAFVGMYQEIERDAEDHFDKLFGREFVRAYMVQTKKLRK